jgi:hypothetical protein
MDKHDNNGMIDQLGAIRKFKVQHLLQINTRVEAVGNVQNY